MTAETFSIVLGKKPYCAVGKLGNLNLQSKRQAVNGPRVVLLPKPSGIVETKKTMVVHAATLSARFQPCSTHRLKSLASFSSQLKSYNENDSENERLNKQIMASGL